MLEMESSDRRSMYGRTKGSLSKAFSGRRHVRPRKRDHGTERRIRQSPAPGGRSHRRGEAARRERRRLLGSQRGKGFYRQRKHCKAVFLGRTNGPARASARRSDPISSPARHSWFSARQGVQQEGGAILSKSGDDLRKRRRAARERRRRSEWRVQEKFWRYVRRGYLWRSRTCCQCAGRLRGRMCKGTWNGPNSEAGGQAVEGATNRSAQDRPHVHADGGAPVLCAPRCLRARSKDS